MKHRKILIISLMIVFSISFILQNLCVSAIYLSDDTEYVWSETTIETSSGEDTGDFLDLSCESAILIEQTTRNYSL